MGSSTPGANFSGQANQDLLRDLLVRTSQLERDNTPSQSWKPEIHATGLAHSFTASGLQGTYLRRGNWVFGRFQWSIVGWGAGTGSTYIHLPWSYLPLVAANQTIGRWWFYHASTGVGYNGTLISTAAAAGVVTAGDFWLWIDNTNTTWGATLPTTVASGDSMSGHFMYEVAPGF